MKKDKKKILYIHDYPHKEGGGVEVQTYIDGLHLGKAGNEVIIATTRITSETFSRVGEQKYPLQVDKGLSLDYINSLSKLQSLIDWADIIHIHATFSLRAGMMSAMKLLYEMKRPYYITLRTTLNHIPFSRLATEDLLTKEDMIFNFTNYLKSDLCTVLGVSNVLQDSLDALHVDKKVKVIYNGKDWDTFTPQDKSTAITDITYIGEVSWMKGLHVLLGALSLLKKDIPHFTARIIGNGQNLNEVKALAESLGLPNISFLSYRDNKDIPNFLRDTKMLVVPSLTESWCNVAMEGMGLGTLLVASATEGLLELTENGKLGLLFERGNVFDCYQKMRSALLDENIIKKFRNPKISQKIRGTYTMKKRVFELEKLYNSIALKPAFLYDMMHA